MEQKYYINQEGYTVFDGDIKEILTESFNTVADSHMTDEDLTEWLRKNPDKLICCSDHTAAMLPGGTIKEIARQMRTHINNDNFIMDMEVLGYVFHDSNSIFNHNKEFQDYIENLALTTPVDQLPGLTLKPQQNIYSTGSVTMSIESSLNENFAIPADKEVEVTAFSIMEEANQSQDVIAQMKALEKALPYLKNGETIVLTGNNLDGSKWEEQITRTAGILVSVVTAQALDFDGKPKPQTILDYVRSLPADNDESYVLTDGVVDPLKDTALEGTDNVNMVFKGASPKVIVLGAGPSKSTAGALAALDALPKASAESVPETKAAPVQPQQSASMIIAKLRARGTDVVIQFMKATSIGQIEHLKRGLYAYYTLNQSIAGMSGRKLAIGVHQNTSVITKGALDWLLDQLGENLAFEVRANRFDVDPNKTYVISKTKEEWMAKGFEVNAFGTVVLS